MSSGDKFSKLTSELKKSESDVLELIETICDSRSFIETDRFVGSDTELGKADGEGIVCGFASINEHRVGIFATNPAVLKGSIGKKGADKIVRLIGNCIDTDAAVIAVLDTQGARFGEGIEAVEGYAKILNRFYSAHGAVPSLVVNRGKNFGLSAYLSGCCDMCIGYDKSLLSTASPLIISAASKVDISKTGTAAVHQKQTGLYTAVVKSDKELKDVLIKSLDLLCNTAENSKDDPNRVSTLLKEGTKAEVLIQEIFDKDSFLPMSASFVPDIITGLARLDGISVGVIAFNKSGGVRLNTNSADKIIALAELCSDYEFPLILLVDCIGTVTDVAEENNALICTVAHLIDWMAHGCSKKIALITGNAIGLGYAAFASKSVSDYTFAYRGAKIGTLESSAAAELLYGADIAKAKDKSAAAKKMEKTYAEENQAAVSVATSGYLDNIIEPAFSRPYLIAALRAFSDKK